MKMILFAIIGIMCLMSCGSNKTFTLWQLESQINTIGNSYVIRTVNGKVIVMDGGQDKDCCVALLMLWAARSKHGLYRILTLIL